MRLLCTKIKMNLLKIVSILCAHFLVDIECQGKLAIATRRSSLSVTTASTTVTSQAAFNVQVFLRAFLIHFPSHMMKKTGSIFLMKKFLLNNGYSDGNPETENALKSKVSSIKEIFKDLVVRRMIKFVLNVIPS
jgi:hypothetical protein